MLRDNVLAALESQRGNLITGGELSKTLGVSRNSIWKIINSLRLEGHDISSIPNKGYLLNHESDGLFLEAIEQHLETELIGNHIRILRSTDSTNSYVKKLPTGELNEGMVVIANEQTAGRGRFDREFVSAANEGIYMSIVVKPDLPIDSLSLLTLGTALCVARTLEKTCRLQPKIKWVNDVLVDNKKICGILTEALLSAELQAIEHAVIGIGINTGRVSKSLEQVATSIQEVTNKKGIRNKLIASVLNEFEEIYRLLKQGNNELILEEYESRLGYIGKKVEVSSAQSQSQVVMQGIDKTGALVGVDDQGKEHHFNAGSITLLKEN